MKLRDLFQPKHADSNGPAIVEPLPRPTPSVPAVAPQHSEGIHSKAQRYRRRLRFSYEATFASNADADSFVAAVQQLVEGRDTIPADSLDWSLGRMLNCPERRDVDLEWTYGWVKGGWRSDGERFIRRALALAGVTPLRDEPVEIVHGEKELVYSEAAAQKATHGQSKPVRNMDGEDKISY